MKTATPARAPPTPSSTRAPWCPSWSREDVLLGSVLATYVVLCIASVLSFVSKSVSHEAWPRALSFVVVLTLTLFHWAVQCGTLLLVSRKVFVEVDVVLRELGALTTKLVYHTADVLIFFFGGVAVNAYSTDSKAYVGLFLGSFAASVSSALYSYKWYRIVSDNRRPR